MWPKQIVKKKKYSQWRKWITCFKHLWTLTFNPSSLGNALIYVIWEILLIYLYASCFHKTSMISRAFSSRVPAGISWYFFNDIHNFLLGIHLLVNFFVSPGGELRLIDCPLLPCAAWNKVYSVILVEECICVFSSDLWSGKQGHAFDSPGVFVA